MAIILPVKRITIVTWYISVKILTNLKTKYHYNKIISDACLMLNVFDIKIRDHFYCIRRRLFAVWIFYNQFISIGTQFRNVQLTNYGYSKWHSHYIQFILFEILNSFTSQCISMNRMSSTIISVSEDSAPTRLLIERKLIIISSEYTNAFIKILSARLMKRAKYRTTHSMMIACIKTAIKYPIGFFHSKGNLFVININKM